jgi:hypothetical protein
VSYTRGGKARNGSKDGRPVATSIDEDATLSGWAPDESLWWWWWVGGGGCEEDFEVTEAIERAAREADEQETRARQLTLDGNLTWDAFDRVGSRKAWASRRVVRRDDRRR